MSEEIVHSPLPWRVKVYSRPWELRLEILDANGHIVFYGDTCGGINFDHFDAPEMLTKAIELLNEKAKTEAEG